ncbi:Nicotinamide-nucleotide amidohydrolase PncC [Rubripirellula obstinata]|uniref:Nicotinamide-nucleotide amidohydrolase PncC n=1 Tax=Rubripirellula obstinata TaxID=406547 RepID=A0A5B1CF23_9BACT|nr:CinA family protein [Rubripirellula obstinata]KAA1258485.1 Nicotinamide-nucleotide amidohydrolase PncC [Rubripirellula obstinata]
MQEATELIDALKQSNGKIVFAESCTGGMVASELAQVPGVSDVFCGSAVTYREATKQSWLGVDGETMQALTAVSAPVAHQMAAGALSQTPEATIAVSITGHLGPNAPEGFDGLVFIAVAKTVKGKTLVKVAHHQLTQTKRVQRQVEATQLVLTTAIDAIG